MKQSWRENHCSASWKESSRTQHAERMRKYLCFVLSLTYRCRSLMMFSSFLFFFQVLKMFLISGNLFWFIWPDIHHSIIPNFLSIFVLAHSCWQESFISWDQWMQESESHPKLCPLVNSFLVPSSPLPRWRMDARTSFLQVLFQGGGVSWIPEHSLLPESIPLSATDWSNIPQEMLWMLPGSRSTRDTHRLS